MEEDHQEWELGVENNEIEIAQDALEKSVTIVKQQAAYNHRPRLAQVAELRSRCPEGRGRWALEPMLCGRSGLSLGLLHPLLHTCYLARPSGHPELCREMEKSGQRPALSPPAFFQEQRGTLTLPALPHLSGKSGERKSIRKLKAVLTLSMLEK